MNAMCFSSPTKFSRRRSVLRRRWPLYLACSGGSARPLGIRAPAARRVPLFFGGL